MVQWFLSPARVSGLAEEPRLPAQTMRAATPSRPLDLDSIYFSTEWLVSTISVTVVDLLQPAGFPNPAIPLIVPLENVQVEPLIVYIAVVPIDVGASLESALVMFKDMLDEVMVKVPLL